MTRTPAGVVDDLVAGKLSLAEAAQWVATFDWARGREETESDLDVPEPGESEWRVIGDDPRLTAQQYATLAKARASTRADDVTAAAEVHTGAMIALVPTDEDAARLAVDYGEDPDELHVTLAYLGEAALIPVEVQDAVVECVARCVSGKPTIVGNSFAVAIFNPETGMTASTGFELDEVDDLVAGAGGQEPCVVLLLSGQQLPNLQEYLVTDVAQTFAANGMQLREQHSPWVAHLTLVYTGDADLEYFTDRTGPVTFDRVRVAFGGDVYDIPLGESAITAAFDPKQPRDDDGRWSRTAITSTDVDDFTRRFKKAKSGRGAFRAVPSVKDLSGGDQRLLDAVRRYTQDYRTLNARMRNGTPLGEKDAETRDGLQELFSQARTDRDIVVSRGVTDLNRVLGPGLWGQGAIGMEWRDDAFTSTTTSEKVARHFTAASGGYEQALINILVPKGTHALDMRGDEFNENEVLLAPGYRYRVVRARQIANEKRDTGDPRWVIDVEVISDGSELTAAVDDVDSDDDFSDDGWDLSPLSNSDPRRFMDDGPPVKITRMPDRDKEIR